MDTGFAEDEPQRGLTPLRAGVMLVALGIAGPAVVVALATAGLPLVWAVAGAVLIFAVTAPFVLRHVPATLAPDRGSRVLLALWLLLCAGVIYQTARHSVFMYDVTRTEFAFRAPSRPLADEGFSRPFYLRHNCFTCYIIGAHLASRRVSNIYDSAQYRDPEEETQIHREIGDAVTIDRYQYPPPFLLLPRLLRAGGDFFETRAYWYALNVGAICLSVVLLSAWVGGRSFGSAWFALPIILAAPVTVGALQIGNVHLLIICICVLAMLAFEHGRCAAGGLLLGFAVLSKLFPGLLLAYLVVTHRWRAVMWTAGFMVLLTFATVLVFGVQPFQAFFDYQLPRLASGEAFAFSRTNLRAMTVNFSVMGAAFKLSHLQMLGDADAVEVAKIFSLVFTAVLAVLLLGIAAGDWKARPGSHGTPRARGRHIEALTWLALLVLAELRSPFLPWGYANLPILWLLAVLLAVLPGHHLARAGTLLLVVGFALNVPLFFGPATVAFDLWYTLAVLAVLLAVCVAIVSARIVRALQTEPAPATL